MSIIKVVKKSGKTYKSMLAVLNYVAEKSDLSCGINCSDDHKIAYKQFIETKEFFGKTDGRQYRHYIQSFPPDEVDKDKALKLGIEWAKKAFEGHEVFIVTHTDREHIHNHIVVNSVNFEKGHKLHESAKDLEKRKEQNIEVCKEYGLDKVIPKDLTGQVITYDKDKYQIIKKGADITKLAQNIIDVSKTSLSVNDFSDKLEKLGYYTEWSENRKHVTFTVDSKILKGNKNKFRLRNLNKTFNIELFEKEKLLEIFKGNREHSFDKIVKNLENKFDDKLNKKMTVEKENIKRNQNNDIER